MSIENVNNFSYNKVDISQKETYVKKGNKEYYSKSTSLSAESLSIEKGAEYIHEEKPEVLTDTGYKVDVDKLIAMKTETEQRMVETFRETMRSGLAKQFNGLRRFLEYAQERFGEDFGVQNDQSNGRVTSFSLNVNISVEMVYAKVESSDDDLAVADVKAAEKDVADDGYWGAEATSQRFLEFAQALSGGDPSKGRMLLEAVEEGFKAAMDILGFSEEDDSIPSLSLRTLELTREKFESWIEGDEEDDDVYTEDVANTFVNQVSNVEDDD